MERNDSLARDVLAEALRSVVDEITREHFDAVTQEHQLTSRICAAMEARFADTRVSGRRVRVIVQEFPDKGRGSAEKKTGVDLYIGVEIDGAVPVSKGLLVQSKWKETKRAPGEHKRLVNQCREMLDRSDAAYVWLYGPEGVDVVPAGDLVDAGTLPPEQLGSRKVSELFRNVFDCFEGDRAIGLPRGVASGRDMRQALKGMIKEMAAERGLVIAIGSSDDGAYEPIDWNPEA
jgi:hypothetical protein